MATCKYCGKDAGWFRNFHDQCKAKDEALQAQKAADTKRDILAALSRGERLTLEGADSFLLQANEELLFVVLNGGYAELKHRGSQEGWSFDHIHQGKIAVTTKRLLFAGTRSVQVTINRIVTVSSNTLNAHNGTVLSGLGVDTGAASRKVFVSDDPSFLAQLIDIARARATARPSVRSTATATNAGADMRAAFAGMEKGLWTGIVSPFLQMIDLMKSTSAVLEPEMLSKNLSDIERALAQSRTSNLESLQGKVPWAADALAAARGFTRIFELLHDELDRLVRLGREVRAVDLRDIEPDIIDAYTDTVRHIKRLDPGFEAAAADWLTQRRRGDSLKARAALHEAIAPTKDGKSTTSTGPQPVGTSITFRVVPAADCPTFAKVGGMEGLKSQLRSTIGLVLREREKAAALGIRFNGVLLYGPPGTGKTFFARACAGEFGCNLLSIGSADIMSAYVGDSPRLVFAAFETAKVNSPIILFFDEFDSIADRRGGGGGDSGGAADRQVLEQLLRNLESIRDRPDVIVIAATNRLDDIDPAIMRPGRFDLKVRVDLPDREAREAIFEAALRNRKAAVADCQALADMTEGLSAAAITSLVDSAALLALQRSGTGHDAIIEMSDLTEAITSRGGKDRPLTKRASWDDLVLPTSTKQELQRLQMLIQDPARAKQFGVTVPRGVLLYGPPGTGKTSIARVLASETRASFYPMSCADLVSRWVGESEGNVMQLFARARENRPSLVFLDEVDAIARRRGADAGNSGLDRMLNQLLQEIDGLEGAEGIFVLAATNRREIIDEALLRGGRLGRQIYVGVPDVSGRETLLRLYSREMPLANDVDLKRLAGATGDWSGADLRQLCEQAAMEAMMSSTDTTAPRVTAENFARALETTRLQRRQGA